MVLELYTVCSNFLTVWKVQCISEKKNADHIICGDDHIMNLRFSLLQSLPFRDVTFSGILLVCLVENHPIFAVQWNT